MRTRPFLYLFLMVLAVFFLPADTFANNGNSPEQASPQADVEKESSNPVDEEASEKGEETSQAAKEQAAEKGSQASETAEEASDHGKQISQETTGKNIQPNRDSEPAEPATKDKASTLPPQASDKASELTNKLKRKAASKNEAVNKQVEDKPQDVKGRSKRSVEKSSGKGQEQPTQTDKHNNDSSADDQADNKEDLQPVESEDDSTNGIVESSATDSGEAKTQKYIPANNQQPNKQEQEKPAPHPEPMKAPIAQIHMTKPASFPSPVSSSGGDFGGQTSFSWVKGNLPGSFQFVASNSQTIGIRSEFLTDQWVNAPPAEPPKTAS